MNEKSDDMEVYRFINHTWRTEYRSPSYREITSETSVNSTSTVQRVLRRLADRGVIHLELAGTRIVTYVPGWLKDAVDSDTDIRRAARQARQASQELNQSYRQGE